MKFDQINQKSHLAKMDFGIQMHAARQYATAFVSEI